MVSLWGALNTARAPYRIQSWRMWGATALRARDGPNNGEVAPYAKPTTVFIPMRMTDVGVATFSSIRNSSVRTAKEQMSMPDPATAEKIPPRT